MHYDNKKLRTYTVIQYLVQKLMPPDMVIEVKNKGRHISLCQCLKIHKHEMIYISDNNLQIFIILFCFIYDSYPIQHKVCDPVCAVQCNDTVLFYCFLVVCLNYVPFIQGKDRSQYLGVAPFLPIPFLFHFCTPSSSLLLVFYSLQTRFVLKDKPVTTSLFCFLQIVTI